MSKRKQLRQNDEVEELEILATRDSVQSTLDYFFAEGLISKVLYTVKSGKEATVYCCQAQPSTGYDLLAAKTYRSRHNRGFKNDAIYQEGRVITEGHVRRAVQNKSVFGREVQFAMWVNYEFETLKALSKAGADTPRPIAKTNTTILMEYYGDHEEAAPSLQLTELTEKQVQPAFNRILANIELWLAHNYVHGDLSAYNILYWQDQARIIDFPQAVDPRFNSNAFALLNRDLENVCQYFARYGLEADADRIARRLWYQFTNAQL